jgi:hypothetical protein
LQTLIFDTETDGLLDELTKLHCLVLADVDTGELVSCLAAEHHDFYRRWRAEQGLPPIRLATIEEGLEMLA